METSADEDVDVKKLIQCATEGNVEEAKTISRLPNIINAADSAGRTALHHAIRSDKLEFVKFLLSLEFKPDVNAATLFDGFTPLHLACALKSKKKTPSPGAPPAGTEMLSDFAMFAMKQKQGSPADVPVETIIKTLLAYPRIDPNKENKYGQTPLHVSAIYENLDACKALLEYKPEINKEAVDKQQMRALHLAASRKDSDVAKELIEHGVELMCQDLNKSTPLHIAAEEGILKTAQLLLNNSQNKKQMLEMEDRMGNTCLHSAVLNNRTDCVVFFIQRGQMQSPLRVYSGTPVSRRPGD